MATTCSNSAGQPFGSTDPSTYLQTQLAKITNPGRNTVLAATTAAPATKADPLNASGRGQLVNVST